MKNIEKMKKTYKAKRGTLEQDYGFVKYYFEKMNIEIKCEKGNIFKFKQE